MFIPKTFTRATMDGHGLIGVLFGAVIYVLCLTGSVLVLTDQLTMWERPGVPKVVRPSPAFIATLSADALAAARSASVAHALFLQFPTGELPRMTVMALGETGGRRDWDVTAAGRLAPHVETPWVAFVQQLHFNLTIPNAIGRYLVGLFGTLLLASIVTGLLAHRRILKDAFRLRWGGSPRLSNADLHNRVGVWALPFHLIVALTGSLLGLAGLITLLLALVAYKGDQNRAIASLLGPQATEDARPAPLPDIRALIRTIAADAPGAEVTQITYEHAGTVGQQVRITTAAPRHLARNESWTFGGDGRLKWKAGFTDGNAGMRIYGMIAPLHYGTYGGVPLKLIYVLLGTGLTLIVATGGNVWLARRREQGRAVARLERLWAATVWGQPLVLALTALVAMFAPATPGAIGWLWLGSTVILLAAAGTWRTDPALLGNRLRVALGGMLIGVAIANLAATAATGEPTALVIDLALGAAGAWLLRGTMTGGRRSRLTSAGA